MRAPWSRVLAAGVAAVLLITSCTGSGDDAADEGGDPAPAVSEPGPTSERDDAQPRSEPGNGFEEPARTTSEDYSIAAVELERPVRRDGRDEVSERSPASWAELWNVGVDQDAWARGEGLIALLEVLVGERDPSSIGGLADGLRGGIAELIEAAQAAVSSTGDDAIPLDADERDQLEMLVDALVVPVATLEARSRPAPRSFPPGETTEIAPRDGGDPDVGVTVPDVDDEIQRIRAELADRPPAGADQAEGSRFVASAMVAEASIAAADAEAEACSPMNVVRFDRLFRERNCWYVAERNVSGEASYRLRAYYPEQWHGTPAEFIVGFTLDTLQHVTTSLAAWGDVSDIDLAFALRDGAVNVNGSALSYGPDDPCRISILSAGSESIREEGIAGLAGDAYQVLVAHEAFHCFQFANVPRQPDEDWYFEAIAEYIAMWFYPLAGADRGWVEQFDLDSNWNPLQGMSYEAWPWWKYVGDHSSPRHVWEIHRRLSGGGSLADEPNVGALFHAFSKQYVAGAMLDLSGLALPYRDVSMPWIPVVADTGTIELGADAFVVARDVVPYAAARRFVQSDVSPTTGSVAAAEVVGGRVVAPWFPGVSGEFTTPCTEELPLVVVATSTAGRHELRFEVEEVEEISCDPCLVGTWRLDNDRFLDALMTWAVSEGGGFPPGFDIRIEGTDLIRFDEFGEITGWRNGWAIVTEAQGITVASIIDATERGSYGAEDGLLTLVDIATTDIRVEVVGPAMGGTFGADGGSLTALGATGDGPGIGTPEAGSGAFTYECTPDALELFAEGYGSVHFDRVEDRELPTSLS